MVGQSLSHYKILRKLGEGGMGEVYLAEDTKLKREVALKVLPPALRNDPERLMRFRREAEAAARLSHPNIATIYSIEEAAPTDDGAGGEQRPDRRCRGTARRAPTSSVLFITMEYVDGRPLHRHIPEQGMPLDQFFAWFLPLTDALCHAHERRVYHRDLKPANVMISKDGIPKILDFGLARIDQPERAEPHDIDSQAPTKGLSEIGAVLGTPSYMSPEQATGKRGDHQSDVFSFGVVMYEALTGQRPFTGDHYISVISSIIKDEPGVVTDLRPAVPYALSRIVRHCLEKETRYRYQTALDLYWDLKDAHAHPDDRRIGAQDATREPAPFWRRPVSLIGATTLILLFALAGWWMEERREAPSDPPLRKFRMPLDNMMPGGPAISPDGTMIAYINQKRLWVRRLSQTEGRAIPDTEEATEPFWSPNGDYIGYRVESALWKISPDGGGRMRLCDLPRGRTMGVTWGRNGIIVFSVSNFASAGLYQVSDRGGDVQPWHSVIAADTVWGMVTPQFLPDQSLAYAVWTRSDSTTVANLAERFSSDPALRFLIPYSQAASSAIVVETPDGARHTLPIIGDYLSVAGYAPSGHLLYYRESGPEQGNLWAAPFSPSSGMVTGEPFPVVQSVDAVSISSDGTLAYRSVTRPPQQLAWVDRRGRIEGVIGQAQQAIRDPDLSPDSRRVVVEAIEAGDQDLWIHDTERGVKTRLTFTRQNAGAPVWSPDGARIVFADSPRLARRQTSTLFSIEADGGGRPQPVATDTLEGSDPDWSSDGRYLAYQFRGNVWYLDMDQKGEPVELLQSPRYAGSPAFSSDGEYLAYESNESGRLEVYVTRFPTGEGRWQVSLNGGASPRWSARSHELFYVEENILMAVPVQTAPGFQAERPAPVFDEQQVQAVPLRFSGYEVSSDGQRFIVVQNTGENRPTLMIVENWIREFRTP